MRESAITYPAATDFRIDEEQPRPGSAVLALHGEADLHSANELRARLGAAIEADAELLVVDLSKVTFIDSTTLGALLEAAKRLRARGGELRIAAPRPEVRRTFELTLLDRVFPLDATRSDALAARAPMRSLRARRAHVLSAPLRAPRRLSSAREERCRPQ